MPLRPPRYSILAVASAIHLSFLCSGFSDSITVNGKRYENIYLGVSADSYYIQDPADGSMVTVPKSSVRERDIEITEDRELRKQLRERWRQKRMNKTFDEPAPLVKAPTAVDRAPKSAAVQKPSVNARADDKTAPETPKTKRASVFTKADSAVTTPTKKTASGGSAEPNRALQGRRVFMSESGTPVMTNRPERFARRPDYVEVTLHYDQIEVPDRFRHRGTPASGKKVTGDNSVDEIVEYYARQYALDKSLVYAVIKAESNGNRYAVSNAGARGLMQLMPGTAREMGVKDIFDPAENIAGGTQYLAKLLNLFDNNVTFALAGYNAGPGNVKKYGGVPPFEETQTYVQRVKRYQREFTRAGKSGIVLASDRPVEKNYLPEESKKYYRIVLDNGLSVAAEQVYQDDDGRFIYVFKGKSGHFTEDAVVQVIEPS